MTIERKLMDGYGQVTHMRGEAEGLMRQFEASDSAFLGPVTLGLRNEVVSPVCLQSEGSVGLPSCQMRGRGRASAWSAVTGTGGSDLLSITPQPALACSKPSNSRALGVVRCALRRET
ncbi:hypothetical protein Q8A67_024108 [Cirrhinus molitorella]|uniref:Uncharacterized protein n=1 Tax=Cirrhinus molitorella TaxID=172907 RepID=A0AA88T969_9TELE|nr:hypothetical protein Q8A67_024108 [Cirrhinus molitorella]